MKLKKDQDQIELYFEAEKFKNKNKKYDCFSKQANSYIINVDLH